MTYPGQGTGRGGGAELRSLGDSLERNVQPQLAPAGPGGLFLDLHALGHG
ncbi:MAG: hypothetical protein ACRDYA_10100 [Egibacteraceae bacterium]